MAEKRRLFVVRGGIILILLAIVCCTVLLYSPLFRDNDGFSNEPTYRALRAAREQWINTKTTHYEIQAKLTQKIYTEQTCSYSVEVRNEEVVFTRGNTCAFAPMPVSQLFDWIQMNLDQYDGTCGINRCWCSGPIGLDVTFDPQQGYPHQATVRDMSQFASEYRTVFERVFPGLRRPCTLIGSLYPKLYEVTLTPLPL